jgi:site-specific recombinase XerD
MDITNSLINYRRFLKRRNYSPYTVRNYLNCLRQFLAWLKVPLEQVTPQEINFYIEFLLEQRKHPKTINCQLVGIRGFYAYLFHEEGLGLVNPVKSGCSLRLPRPLPRHLKDGEVAKLFAGIKDRRDRALFMLMLRCGLRVAEVAALTSDAIDHRRRRIYVHSGKGGKGRVVYLSADAHRALADYLKVRPSSPAKYIFLADKGQFRGQPLSIRGIQKRLEYYTRKTGVRASCHHLRHTMATQMLNADADLATIQDLLGHSRITTTQRYCRVSNLKVERDYYKAMELVQQRSGQQAPPGKH